MPESIIIAPSDKVTTYHEVQRPFGRWKVYKAGEKVDSFKGSFDAFDNKINDANKNPQLFIQQYQKR